MVSIPKEITKRIPESIFGVYVYMVIFSCQDVDQQWKALPYEATGALVRSLMLHCHRIGEANASRDQALAEDPQQKKAVTKRLVDKAAELLHVKKYLVFNPRTGQLATEQWLSKNIQVQDGKPKFKHPSKQHKSPKILTLTICVADNDLDLKVDLGNGNDMPLRCYDLRQSEPLGDMELLQAGFGHMADDWAEEDGDEIDFDEVDSAGDDNDYEDEIMGDEHGLEGFLPLFVWVSIVTYHAQTTQV